VTAVKTGDVRAVFLVMASLHFIPPHTQLGLAVVASGFVRAGTSARAFQKPMSAAESAACVRAWLAQPMVRVVEPGPDHEGQVLKLLEALGTARNLVTDAQIAALAIDQDAVLHTADADFQRFPRCAGSILSRELRADACTDSSGNGWERQAARPGIGVGLGRAGPAQPLRRSSVPRVTCSYHSPPD